MLYDFNIRIDGAFIVTNFSQMISVNFKEI